LGEKVNTDSSPLVPNDTVRDFPHSHHLSRSLSLFSHYHFGIRVDRGAVCSVGSRRLALSVITRVHSFLDSKVVN